MYANFQRDWLWSFIGEIGARIGSLCLFVGYVPILGNEPVGKVLVGYAYAMTSWLLIDLGLGLYATKEVAAARKTGVDRLQVEITVARALLAIAGIALYFLLSGIVVDSPGGVVVSFSLFLLCRALAVDWRLRGEGRFKEIAFIYLIASLLQIGTAVALVSTENWELTAAMPWAAYGLTLVLGCWYVTKLKGGRELFKKSTLRESIRHISKSIGFSASNGLSVLFQQSPVLVLSTAFGAGAISGFALVHRIALSSVVFFQVLGSATFPRLVVLGTKSKKSAWELSRKIGMLILVLSLLLLAIFLALTLFPAIRELYLKDISYTVVISFGLFMVLRSVRVAVVRFLFATERQGDYARISGWILLLFLACMLGFWWAGVLTEEITAITFALVEGVMLLLTMMIALKTSVVDGEVCIRG